MYSYADTFEQPVVVKIGGKDITLPVLSQRTLLPWIEEATEKWREAAKKNAPPANAKENARSRWNTWVDTTEITPPDLSPKVLQVNGTIRVLQLSLTKAGVSIEDADVYIDSRPAMENTMHACRLSGLYAKEQLEEMFSPPKANGTEKRPPNDETPAE